MANVEIEIDGQQIVAEAGQTVMQVADNVGIYIPRFCYHKHLSIAGNCRMCIVEVEKSPKPLPACATPVMPGMKVFTKSRKTIDAQRAVMEFLLINHPLDCPICDQGGECELQDLSLGYGSSHSEYDETKRSVVDEDLGPLIETEMTRCIYCTRCVRFGDEIAGFRELGATYRGENQQISTYVQHALKSEVSGNIIDLCPVGALTSKPYRFTARPWELQQSTSISPHDNWGANLYIHTLWGKVMRVVSKENPHINETWISDRDRFSYEGLYHETRLEKPLMRVGNEWKPVGWQVALEAAARLLKTTIEHAGPDQFASLTSPNATLEEMYLLQKLTRALGSRNIDYRLRQQDTRDQDTVGLAPGLQISIDQLEQCDAILLIGCNLQKEQPLAALRVRKAIANGAKVAVINSVDYHFNFKTTCKSIVAPHILPEILENLTRNEQHELCELFKDKQQVAIICGAQALNHPQAANLLYWAEQLASQFNASLNILTEGANASGAWIAGAIPHRLPGGQATEPGLNAYDAFKNPRHAYLLLNVEPELDTANSSMAVHALKQAKAVVALSMYRNPVLEECADVILPIAAFTETAGTFVNAAGVWQSFTGSANAFGEARPAWKVLRVLGNFLELDGFDYDSTENVKSELQMQLNQNEIVTKPRKLYESAKSERALSRVGEIPIYAVDSIVRRSQPLQTTQEIMDGDLTVARLHPDTAIMHQLQNGQTVQFRQGNCESRLTIMLDERIAPNAIAIAGGVAASRHLGDLFGSIEMIKN